MRGCGVQLTIEMVVVAIPIIAGAATLVWKAATKLGSIESKVDQCITWIEDQKTVAAPVRKRSRR